MKSVIVAALLVLGSVSAFAEGEGSGENPRGEGTVLCTGVKIVGVVNTDLGEGGGSRPQAVYDISGATCQPAAVYTTDELNSRNSDSGN